MDGMFLLLVILVAVTIILRAMTTASHNSAREHIIREIVKESIQKRKLDELYGRTKDPEDQS